MACSNFSNERATRNFASRAPRHLDQEQAMVNNAKEQPEFRGTTKQRPTAVCIIVENLPVPLDRRVWREAAALRDAGYSVSVICPKGKGSCTASHEVLEGIHIYRHAMWEPSSALGYLLEYALALVKEIYNKFKETVKGWV